MCLGQKVIDTIQDKFCHQPVKILPSFMKVGAISTEQRNWMFLHPIQKNIPNIAKIANWRQ